MLFAVEYVEQNKQSSVVFIAFNNDRRCPPWQRAAMRWGIAVAVLLLAGCGSAPPEPPIRIDVEEMAAAYAADEQSAEARFVGRAMLVDGVVTAVGAPGSAKPVAWLDLPGEENAPAFLASGPATVRAGQAVTLRCDRADHVGTVPYLYGCRIS